MLVISKETAVARAELREGASLAPWERSLRSGDGWGLSVQKVIGAEVSDGLNDEVRMDLSECGLEVSGRKRAVGEMGGDDVRVFGEQRMLHGSWARVGDD